MYFVRQISLAIGRRYIVCCREACSKFPSKLPEEPTNCCMSGCANCVWIEYAEKVKEIVADIDSEEVRNMVLNKIQDPNLKTFLSMELKLKGF